MYCWFVYTRYVCMCPCTVTNLHLYHCYPEYFVCFDISSETSPSSLGVVFFMLFFRSLACSLADGSFACEGGGEERGVRCLGSRDGRFSRTESFRYLTNFPPMDDWID